MPTVIHTKVQILTVKTDETIIGEDHMDGTDRDPRAVAAGIHRALEMLTVAIAHHLRTMK